jgi:hypothetical protein
MCDHVLMTSDKESNLRRKGNPIWKIIFIPLIIVHVIFYSVVGYTLFYVYTGAMILIVAIPLAIVLAFIEFIAVFLYIIKQHPRGKAKLVGYTALAVVSPPLIFFGFWIIPVINQILF